MAIVGERYNTRSGPLVRKQAVDFICADHGGACHGWPYAVGTPPREVCSVCWAAPRTPPMKWVGGGLRLL